MSLFGSKNRHRRHRDGSSVLRTPSQLRQSERVQRVSGAQVLGCAAVAVICVALIALIWINTERNIQEQSEEIYGRVEAMITAEDATLTAQAQHELQMIDQSLMVLQAAWNRDPDTFKLADWRKTMPALTEVADDLFIANEQHVVVQDINPAAVGQGIGAAYATFSTGSLEPIRSSSQAGRDNLVIGELGSGAITRQYLMYLLRPLAKPAGWVIGASYRSTALSNVFTVAGLGQRGFAALIDTHRGGVQAVAGSAALRPNVKLNDTPMYTAMLQRPGGGIWQGRTPIDGVERIIAFRRVPDRDLMVLVGVVTDQAMAPAENLAAQTRAVAAIASLLVLAVGATLLWEVWHWRSTRRRRRALAQAEALVTSMQTDLAALRAAVSVGAAQLQATLGGIAEGAAVIDANHHLAAWNPRFAALSTLAQPALREGVLLEELLRQMVLAGRFGPATDIDAAVARLVAALRLDAGAEEVTATAQDGSSLVLRAQPIPDGGLVLILGRADMVPDVVELPAAADPVEW